MLKRVQHDGPIVNGQLLMKTTVFMSLMFGHEKNTRKCGVWQNVLVFFVFYGPVFIFVKRGDYTKNTRVVNLRYTDYMGDLSFVLR